MRNLCARIPMPAAPQKKQDPAGPVSLSCDCRHQCRPPFLPGLPGTPPSSSFEREGLPWFELPGSQPSAPLPTPWLQACRGGGLLDEPPHPVAVTPVTVTAAPARASPSNVPPVRVIAEPARMVPAKLEVVMVAAASTHQYTLQAVAPPAMTTWKLVPVSAPTAVLPTLNSQTALAGPTSVNVPVTAAAASKQ